MTELLTAAQMRAIENAAIASGEVTGLELMERAGRGVVEAIFEEWPELAKGAPVEPQERGPAPAPPGYFQPEKGQVRRAVVLCGPGNNGGDGFVVARLLKEWGWEVEVFLYGDAGKLPPDARTNCERWLEMGEVQPLTVAMAGAGRRPDVLVDAMFGIGLTRTIPLELALAHHAVEMRDVGDTHPWLVPYHRVAVDCPSGLDCDSGKFLLPERPADLSDEDLEAAWRWWSEDASQRLLRTDLTVTFHRRKIGHALTDVWGKVRIADIGLGQEDCHPAHLTMPRPTDRVMALDFDRPNGRSRRIWPGFDVDKGRGVGRHKYDHGHALILSGGPGHTGAARMAARGALRIGAGLVTVGVPGSAQLEAASHVTAIMLQRAGTSEEAAAALEDTRINALCLGPGMGVDRARDLVPVALRSNRATVLDADALTAFEEDPDTLFGLLHENCVLTPHGGEFRRLFPDIAEKLNAPAARGPAYSKVDATREAAARAGCVVLFKGPDTVIAHPDGRCSVNAAVYERAAPWLATAGAGDVLGGFITGLLARGFAPMQAAETAAWLHVECARSFGPGLIAEDLPEELPKVLRALDV